MTDAADYEAPEHVWGPLWRFASMPKRLYIFTPQGRLLRPHVWLLWYAWYKWEQCVWLRRKRERRGR